MVLNLSIPALLAIAVSVLGFVILSTLTWWLTPKLVGKILRVIDSIVVLDILDYRRPISRFVIIVLVAMLFAATVFAVITQLGVDTTGVQMAARSNGAAVGKWIGPKALRILIIVGLTLIALRIISRLTPQLVRLFIKDRHDSLGESEVEKRAQTLEGAVRATFSISISVIALFTILSELGVAIGPLLAGVGIAGIAIGFGAQSLVKDIIAGMFILLEDQYRVGDVIRIAGTAGLVEDVNLRRTVLRDLDFIQHFIPNGEIGVASNFTKEKSRVNLNIQVAYKEDLDRVIELLNHVGQQMSKDEYFGGLITDQIKVLRVDAFDESGIAIKVLGETLPLKQWEVTGEFRKRVKKAFDESNIEIPLPHRTLYWGNNVETKIVQLLERQNVQKAAQEEKTVPEDRHADR